MKKVLIVLVLLGLAATGYYLYSVRAGRAAGVPEYTTATVTRGEVVQVVTATGQLDAVLSVDVGSQISGQIVKLHADFNTVVKAGQKLVEIDPATYQQRLRQAEASLASAQASYTLAELNARRTKELFDKNLVTRQDHDQSQAQLQQARAQLLTNQAVVENARVDLSRCTIYSPIDGIVIVKQTEVGKTVASSLNVPVLFTIANDLAKMQITAAVAEADIGSVAEGQSVTFMVDAFPNRTFKGTITQVRNAPKNANNVVTYDTIIGVDNRDLKLRPGMTANVSIVVARREGALRAPNAALRVRLPEGIAVAQAPVQPGGQTAAPAAPAPSSAPAAGNNREGGRGGFMANMTPEQRQKMRDIMAEIGFAPGSGAPTPEQREQMRKLMVERGVITAEQAAASVNRAAAGEPAIVTRTLYRLPRGDKSAAPEAMSVRVGITDGLASEIVDGVSEGDVVVTSVTITGAKPAGAQTNPFSGGRRF